MADPENWNTVKPGNLLSHRFTPGEELVSGLATFARENGITSAVIVSCIGSVTDLRLHNLSGLEADRTPLFQDRQLSEILEIVSVEGNITPSPDGDIRTHVHIMVAKPGGEVIGGHCEEARICTGGYMFLQVLEPR